MKHNIHCTQPFFRQSFDSKMAVSQEIANLPLSLERPFDGDASLLPRHSFPFQGSYVSCPYVTCRGGLQVFVASIPSEIIGGRRWRRVPRSETLCVLLLNEMEEFTRNGFTSLLPARFFWLNRAGRFRAARLFYGRDTMRSVVLTSYNAQKQQLLAVHRILGWTFRCPWDLLEERWSAQYDIAHRDDRHWNNNVLNLRCWSASGSDGHRAESGRAGALRALQNAQAADAEAKEEPA